MPAHEGAHRRNLDLVIFADQLGRRSIREGATTMFALCRDVVADLVGICGKRPPMALVAGLRSARPGVLPPLLAIRRRRPGRSARRLLRPLQPQHQIDQLLFGKALQLVPIHRILESSNRSKRKSLAKFLAHGRIAKLTSPVGNYFSTCCPAYQLSDPCGFSSNGPTPRSSVSPYPSAVRSSNNK